MARPRRAPLAAQDPSGASTRALQAAGAEKRRSNASVMALITGRRKLTQEELQEDRDNESIEKWRREAGPIQLGDDTSALATHVEDPMTGSSLRVLSPQAKALDETRREADWEVAGIAGQPRAPRPPSDERFTRELEAREKEQEMADVEARMWQRASPEARAIKTALVVKRDAQKLARDVAASEASAQQAAEDDRIMRRLSGAQPRVPTRDTREAFAGARDQATARVGRVR